MDNSQLTRLLNSLLKHSYRIKEFGVIIKPEIPKYFLNPACFILYHDFHYFATYLSRDTSGFLNVEIFDSLANNPIEKYNLTASEPCQITYNNTIL